MRNNFITTFALSLFVSFIPIANLPGFEKNGKAAGDDDGSIGAILLDISHGVFFPPLDHPDNGYTQLQGLLREMGHPTVVSDSGVLQLDLTGFDGIIINPPWASHTPYTEEEVSIILDFVEGGGGLLIMGGFGPSKTTENINPVAQAFGTTTGVTLLCCDFTITSLADHSIFRGVERILFFAGGELEVLTPSEAIAWDDAGRVVVAVAESGEGHVAIICTWEIFDDHVNPSFSENETFIRNIFLWLMRSNCISFEDLNQTIAEAEINSHGVRNSLQSKAKNARRQYKRGNLRASGNILCALLHEVDAQDGRHIDPASAREIRDCIQSMAEALEIPLPCHERMEKVALFLETSPNPFSAITQIRYTLPASPPQADQRSAISSPIPVRLAVYDIAGRLVETLVNESQDPGVYQVQWEGKDQVNGIYFYHLKAGDFTNRGKIILLK